MFRLRLANAAPGAVRRFGAVLTFGGLHDDYLTRRDSET
jgi:hypothetical protein